VRAPEESLREVLARFPQVQAAFLFGSRAEGRARADSDWNLALLRVQREALKRRWLDPS